MKKSQAKQITFPSQASEGELIWFQNALHMVEDLIGRRIPRLWERLHLILYAFVLNGLPYLIIYNGTLWDFIHWDVGLNETFNVFILALQLVILKLVAFYPFENKMQKLFFCHFLNFILKLSYFLILKFYL